MARVTPARHSLSTTPMRGVLLLALAGCTPSVPEGAPRVQIMVPSGASLRAIADTLAAHGVIEHPFWFRTLARLTRADRAMQTGRYEFVAPSPTGVVLRALERGNRLLTRLTIPEGLTRLQLAELLEQRLGIPPDSLLGATRDSSLLREYGIDAPNAEGYLWPETYLIDSTESPRELVTLLLRGFQDQWEGLWSDSLETMGPTRHEIVTLASIVEGEAQLDEERPIIAAVYLNRLRIGMALQADPTVQYAIEQETGERKTRLYERDYQFLSPYNTYLVPGLPPGPIGSPGRKSIEAVLFPADVPYLYFVADSGGRHRFSTSYQDHLRAIRRVRSTR